MECKNIIMREIYYIKEWKFINKSMFFVRFDSFNYSLKDSFFIFVIKREK